MPSQPEMGCKDAEQSHGTELNRQAKVPQCEMCYEANAVRYCNDCGGGQAPPPLKSGAPAVAALWGTVKKSPPGGLIFAAGWLAGWLEFGPSWD